MQNAINDKCNKCKFIGEFIGKFIISLLELSEGTYLFGWLSV